MWLHLPSAFVGSLFAGSGFLLVHRELSHRRRLTTRWELQEYAEAQWKDIRKTAKDSVLEGSKKNVQVDRVADKASELRVFWNKAVSSLRESVGRKNGP